MRVEPAGGVLLDTCAAIFLVNGEFVARDALSLLDAARSRDILHVSTVSAWEIGLLSRSRMTFLPDPRTWFSRLIQLPGVRHAPITPEIAIDSSYLPGTLHGDPADRMLVATARHLGVPIATRDRQIIAYAKEGHVQAIAC